MKSIEKLEKKNSLVCSWYVFKKFILYLKTLFGCGFGKIRVVSGYDIEVEVSSKNVYPCLLFLKKHSLCLFKSMVDIICYDTPSKKNRFFVVYNLLSVELNVRLRVITKVAEHTPLLSCTSLFWSAGWSEREIFDFYGVFFFLNKDLRRILTDYGFKGFPLRKDFPLIGFVDVYYDDNQKRICYRDLAVAQEYRSFDFSTNWNL